MTEQNATQTPTDPVPAGPGRFTVPEEAAATLYVLGEVLAERMAQDDKWGEQNHPDGTGNLAQQSDAKASRQWCQDAFGAGYGTWSDVLAEEVAEANAERDPAALRAELVQVAAVAVAWIEAIDRRAQPGAADVAFLNAEFPDEPQDPIGPATAAGAEQ